jgi:hypothetical protein
MPNGDGIEQIIHIWKGGLLSCALSQYPEFLKVGEMTHLPEKRINGRYIRDRELVVVEISDKLYGTVPGIRNPLC